MLVISRVYVFGYFLNMPGRAHGYDDIGLSSFGITVQVQVDPGFASGCSKGPLFCIFTPLLGGSWLVWCQGLRLTLRAVWTASFCVASAPRLWTRGGSGLNGRG